MPEFHIINREGKDTLLKTISEDIDVSGRVAVGIVLDANDNVAARWQSLKDRIRENNIALPDKPEPSGTIIAGVPCHHPRIGIWLMPDNQSPGELEDFIEKMIPRNDAVWPLSVCYIDSIPEENRKFKEIKAKVHAWLATKEEPLKLGTAIRARYFDVKCRNL